MLFPGPRTRPAFFCPMRQPFSKACATEWVDHGQMVGEAIAFAGRMIPVKCYGTLSIEMCRYRVRICVCRLIYLPSYLIKWTQRRCRPALDLPRNNFSEMKESASRTVLIE